VTAISPRQWGILLVILCSYLMIVLDTSVVITALPHIRQTFAMSTTGLSWVQNAYTLAFGGLLLLGARAGDILGRRRMFVIGLSLFMLASLLVAVAQGALLLIAARGLQGMGAAILAPSSLALLLVNFEGHQRTRAIALYGATAGVGSSLGLLVGGVLTQWASWRAGFLINLPLGLALILGTLRAVRETESHSSRFDLAGALLSTAGMTSLVFGIVSAANVGWRDQTSVTGVVVGMLLLGVFIFHEARTQAPILPLRLFQHRVRAGAYTARLLFLGAMMSFYFFTTQYLQEVAGFSASEAGLAFLPATLANFAAALAIPRLTRTIGNATLLAGGVATGIAGMIWLSTVSADSRYLTDVALPLVLIGLSQGACLSPLTAAAMTDVDGRDAGAASGLVNVSHQLGGTLGLSVLTVAYSFSAQSSDSIQSISAGISATYLWSAVMLALAFVVVLAFIVRPAPEPVAGSQRQA
jgi:EmrB/QacA subfamily drug resistance transporter